ncbi:MAG TPA: hypothetical protein VLA89_12250 [Gemmatimonadales bacterium]|nr:hypothetical protein [Gemmatimonadales bacterium]
MPTVAAVVLTPAEQYEYLRLEVRYHLTAPGDRRRGNRRARAAIADYAQAWGEDRAWCAKLFIELMDEVNAEATVTP